MDSLIIKLFPFYLSWHYSKAFVDAWRVWLDLQWFIWHFFSVGLLLRTFFSPFKRVREEVSVQSLNFEGIFGSIVVNLIMRLVGALVRSVLIIAAVVSSLVLLILGLVWLLLWLVWPVLTVFTLFAGLWFLIIG